MSQKTDTPDSLYKDAEQAVRDGRLQDALTALSGAIEIAPTRADVHYKRGNVLRRLDRAEAAESALREALRLDPRLADACFSLVFLLRDQGRIQDICAILGALADAIPEDAERIEQAAGLLADYGCFPEALDLFQRAASLRPELPRLDLQIGQLQQKLGQFADAQTAFMEAIRKDPLSGPAYLLMAHNNRASDASDARLGLCAQALDSPSLPENTRICLHFALGKLQDDVGNYEQAFRQLKSGNMLRRAQTGFDRTVWQQYFLDLQKILPLQLENQPGRESPTPVFIVGMPRSGTTLMHRLLSNHPAVIGLGETEMVDQLVETLARHTATDYPACLSSLRATDFALLARQYRARWPREASGARYVLDKNPLNFMHIGLIARLFPEARFIHCLRDPRDVALSIYFQNFAHPRNSYAYDLEDIGHFYAGYHALMVHWQSVFGARIQRIRYEHVVTRPEDEIRQLLSALGLEWDEACIAPETGNQGISTASVWQARQPLYSDSIGRWHHYEQQLRPFLGAVPSAALQYQSP
jgi:tetratricopeptide (TPR) repeat protein